jgi:hypothetical protein
MNANIERHNIVSMAVREMDTWHSGVSNLINVTKLDSNGVDHNKLRFFKTLKGSFTQEPYVTNIKNKSQRAWLTRFRVSAVSNLRIESVS